jgi:predicted lipoprotein
MQERYIRPVRAATALTAALGISLGAAQAGALPADLGPALARGYIAPAMVEFQQAAVSMREGMTAFCPGASLHAGQADAVPAMPEGSGKSGHEGPQASASHAREAPPDALELDRRFGRLVQAWSGIAFLRFGPLVDSNRFERIFFWPDPRGVMLRQIQGQLAAADKAQAGEEGAGAPGSILDPQALATHSVALQGLPALEYMLYRDTGLLRAGAQEAQGFAAACGYSRAIAGNLASIGSELASLWGGSGDYAARFSKPAGDNPIYRSNQEVAGEAIKALSTGLQFTRDIELLPMLGSGPAKASEKKAPFWRSGKSALALAASARGLAAFHDAAGWRYAADEAWIGSSIDDELTRAAAAFESVAQGLAQAAAAAPVQAGALQAWLETEEGYRQLVLASLLLKNAKGIVDENMAPAFGARIGFNALDGD